MFYTGEEEIPGLRVHHGFEESGGFSQRHDEETRGFLCCDRVSDTRMAPRVFRTMRMEGGLGVTLEASFGPG